MKTLIITIFLVSVSFLAVPSAYPGQVELGVNMPYWIDCGFQHTEIRYKGVDNDKKAIIEFWLGLGTYKSRHRVIFVDVGDRFYVDSYMITVLGFNKDSLNFSVIKIRKED